MKKILIPIIVIFLMIFSIFVINIMYFPNQTTITEDAVIINKYRHHNKIYHNYLVLNTIDTNREIEFTVDKQEYDLYSPGQTVKFQYKYNKFKMWFDDTISNFTILN